MRRSPSERRSEGRVRGGSYGVGFGPEQLEARQLLTSSPLPLLTDLTNPNNTVIRFETNQGDIYIEMFDSAAPITVANFLKYVRDGDYDKTFFHRKISNFVVQGGAFRLKANPTGSTLNSNNNPIPIDAQIQNEFNQTNAARTIAMAKLGGNPNSATSQFFFNLANNTSLDSQNGGFTVFGRVANDASWSVVQGIGNLTDRNLDVQSTNPDALFANVPLAPGGSAANGIQESDLVIIEDAEIVKPQGVAAFYTFKYFFPEGFAGSNISEFIPIGNPGGSAARYQMIVRSEVAKTQPTSGDFWFRDKVVSTGTINGNSRGGVTLSQKRSPGQNLVESGVPYAVEVWSTSPLAVSMSHYDFGSMIGESFTTQTALNWTFPDVRKGAGLRTFILWQTVAEETANLSVRFFRNGFDPITVPWSNLGFRRGGLDIANLASIPEGTYSVQITSDQPIVASMSFYDTNTATRGGMGMLGVQGRGARAGVLPIDNIGATGVSSVVSIFNPGTAGTAVSLIFTFDDGTEFANPGTLMQPQSRIVVDLSTIPSIQNKTYTVRFSSSAQNVYASVLHRERGDYLGNGFTSSAATIHDFGEGFMNGQRAGTNLFETLSVYNPNITTLGQTNADAAVIFRFTFTDGTVVNEERSLAAGRRLDLDLTTFQPILNQNAGGRFFYSVQIVTDVPVVAMMRHWDLDLGGLQPSGGGSFLGIQRGTIVTLGPSSS